MNALSVKCPACGAAPFASCISHAGHELISVRKHGKTKRDVLAKENAARMCAPHESRLHAAVRGS